MFATAFEILEEGEMRQFYKSTDVFARARRSLLTEEDTFIYVCSKALGTSYIRRPLIRDVIPISSMCRRLRNIKPATANLYSLGLNKNKDVHKMYIALHEPSLDTLEEFRRWF